MSTRDVCDRHLRNEVDDDSSIQELGDVLYLTLRARRNGRDELIGTDTFVIHDDLIHMHTFYGSTPTPTADDRS
jgi:hypothetical protein